MKNTLSMRVVAILLVTALALDAVGCTSLKEVGNIKDVTRERIVVFTKGGTEYDLEVWWTSPTNGDISGKGTARKQYYQRSGQFEVQTAFTAYPFQGTISADSIATIKHEKVDYMTPLLVIALLSTTIWIFSVAKVQVVGFY